MATEKRIAGNTSYWKYRTSLRGSFFSARLQVAQFQRNYVWSKKHIAPLIQSIMENEHGYYIGNIIIQRCNSGSGGRDLIVDGQQRLVTLSLIIKVLETELLKERSARSKVSGECAQILFIRKREPFISFSRKNLDKIYKSILRGEKITKENIKQFDEAKRQLFKSYEFIIKKIKPIENKKELFNKILSLEFVVIKCPSKHNVHQLFESLNSRGKKLSTVQLTKNSLLDSDKLKKSDFSKINNSWERIEKLFEESGSKIIWFDKFFRHQWFSVGGYISESDLFEKTKKKIKDIGPVEYSKILEEDSKIYIALRRGEPEKLNCKNGMGAAAYRKVGFFIENIKRFNSDQIYAVILALLKYGKSNQNYFKKDKLSKDLEKMWCYLLLLRYSRDINPSSYEKAFADFCYQINNPNSSIKVIKTNFFKKLRSIIPSSRDFTELINKRIRCSGKDDEDISFDNHRDIVRSLLAYYLDDGEKIISDESESIEHIIPKGNLVNWKRIAANHIEEVKECRYKLGNLTLLENRLNGIIENADFKIKNKDGYKKSKYDKNKKIKKYEKYFNSNNPCIAIKKRGEEMAQEIYKSCTSKLEKK